MTRILAPVLAGLMMALAFSSCRQAPAVAATAPARVTVAKPVPQRLKEWDEFSGRLSAVASVEVRARVSGYIESTHFTEGRDVKAGDLLFTIDPRRYAAEFARAQAGFNRAQAAL